MRAPEDQAFQAFIDDLQTGSLSYEDAKQRYMALGDAIRQRYEREITALSVDVVQSRAVKDAGTALDVQLAFDAYHRWVEERLAAYGCYSGYYTWAGDGLLAIFPKPEDAVAVGRTILEGLPAFNARHNPRLPPIQVRVGAHTGPIITGRATRLADDELGKIASHTFDLAGHLQKAAAPNQMRISETTYTLLRDGRAQFGPVRLEVPTPSSCFAYPAHSIPATEYQASQTVTLQGPHPMATERPQLPWLWIGGGAVVIVFAIVMFVSGFLGARGTATANPGGGTGELVVVAPEPEPLPASPSDPPATGGGGSGGNPAPVPRPNEPTTPTPAPAPPVPVWGPSTALWRSPDADSGLPPRFAPAPPERKWLLAIGIGRYRDRAFNGDNAGADATQAARALQQSGGVPPDHVRVLTDEQATLNNVKTAFQWLQDNASSGQDTVLVYLAGHGMLGPDRPGAPRAGGSGYALAPHDASAADLPNTLVYGSDMAAWLGSAKAQTVLVFNDSSHAGAMDVPGAPDPGRQYGLMASVSAARRGGAGVFTATLADGLRGAADANRDRRISLEELRGFLQAEAPRRSGGALQPEARAGFGGYLPALDFIPGA